MHPFFPDREVTVILDDVLVDMAFGTGCVKITPAHDPNDYECGMRHKLPFINILNEEGEWAFQAFHSCLGHAILTIALLMQTKHQSEAATQNKAPHSLFFVSSGMMNESCGKFTGMHRFEVRELLIQEFKNKGLYRGKSPNPMAIGWLRL